MKLKELYYCIENKTNLYIDDKPIKILQIFDIFNICEILYLEDNKKRIIDVMGITDKKQNNKFINLNRLGGLKSDNSI